MTTTATVRRGRTIIALLFLLALAVPLGVSAGLPQAPRASVDPAVLRQTAGAQQANFWVILRNRANLRAAFGLRSWAARGSFVVDRLQETATASQAGVRAFLDRRQVKYRPFWIANAIRVTGDRAILEALEAMPEVAKIVPDGRYSLPKPIDPKRGPRPQAVEWNIERIRAPEVWSTFDDRGEGIVVASIDSGVQFDHPALVNQYRGNKGNGVFDHNYNWFDPLSTCGQPSLAPCDTDVHGTHTMGTMIGDDGEFGENQIGVAPGAKWIAAKGCAFDECLFEALMASGQWMLAPTDLNGGSPRPDLRPQVINNSWGGDFHDDFYQAIVTAWVASGIFPVFAAGNAGPRCRSAGSPGDYVDSYAVGAFDSSDAIAPFSSRGPAVFGDTSETKPNIAAPGVDVRSSIPGNSYELFSGTSMAAPHVAGTVALLWSAAPALIGDISGTRTLLDRTAVDVADDSCAAAYAAPLIDGNIDNDVWGEGRLDAFAAVAAAPRGPTGVLTGTVTDAGAGSPIGGAKIEITGTFTRTIVTDSAGSYTTRLPLGTFDLTATAFGYAAGSASGITITEGMTRTQDFALTILPRHVVSGHVTDTAGAAIFGARVTLEGTPLAPATTDADGFYSLPAVPAGAYSVRVEAGGCNAPQTRELIVDGDETLDIALVQLEDSYGYFCHTERASYVDATNTISLTGDIGLMPVDLPFPFTLYGQTYTSTVFVRTDGFLNFLISDAPLDNLEIPNAFVPNAAVYPFWDDLLLDQDSSVRTEVVGAAPNRGFVIEWRNATFFLDIEKRVSFEVILYEDGQILMQYRDILDSELIQGGSATIGIENETGTVALQYSYNKPLIRDGLAIRYQLPPSGFVQGAVTDANDNQPVSGATVRALRDGAVVRVATTDAYGAYRVQLPLGSYTLEAGGDNYSLESAQVLVSQENATITQNFRLRSARAEVSPTSFDFILPAGQRRSATLTLSNTGTLDMSWEILETVGLSSSQARALPALPKLARKPTWSKPSQTQRLPLALPRVSASAPSEVIIDDPSGDANGSVDVTTVRGGTSGVSATIALDFSESTPIDQVVGYVLFDTDQNQATGQPPDFFFGLPSQDIGVDYYASLFSIHDLNPSVLIFSVETGALVASVPVTIDGHTVAFEVPFAALGDEGAIDIALVLGDFFQPTDWAPDIGHGTLVPFVDIPWLSASPANGALAPGAAQNIAVTVDTAGLEPGVYDAAMFVKSNSAIRPMLRVPVHLIVPGYQQAVNNGGGAYTDHASATWAADQAYTAGRWGYVNRAGTATTRSPIAGTDDDPLYQSARRGLVEYRFDGLPAGTYEVELRFAEIQGKRRDKRIFDVLVEGGLVLPAHDIAAEVGGLTADNHTFFVAVTDGQLSVRLVTRSGFNVPLINAMRVTHRPDK